MRPPSIVLFERCYLGALIVGLASQLPFWPRLVAAMRASPAVAQMAPGYAEGFLAIGFVLTVAITLLLWFFVARRASVVAKWIVTLLFVVRAVSLLGGFAGGTRRVDAQGAIALLSFALDAVAVAMLFRADARAWFARRVPDGAIA